MEVEEEGGPCGWLVLGDTGYDGDVDLGIARGRGRKGETERGRGRQGDREREGDREGEREREEREGERRGGDPTEVCPML